MLATVKIRVAAEVQRVANPGVEVLFQLRVGCLQSLNLLEAGRGVLLECIDGIESILFVDAHLLVCDAVPDRSQLLAQSGSAFAEQRVFKPGKLLIDEELQAGNGAVEDAKPLVEDTVPRLEQGMVCRRSDEDGGADGVFPADAVQSPDALLHPVGRER